MTVREIINQSADMRLRDDPNVDATFIVESAAASVPFDLDLETVRRNGEWMLEHLDDQNRPHNAV